MLKQKRRPRILKLKHDLSLVKGNISEEFPGFLFVSAQLLSMNPPKRQLVR